jgi:uncharacterized protein YkwD
MSVQALWLDHWSIPAEQLSFPTVSRVATSVHDHFIPHERNNYHPHILGHRVLGLFSFLLLTVKVSAIALVVAGPVTTSLASAITADTIISLTNSSRASENLSQLQISPLLTRAAQAKADDMLARQYFSHNTPDGKAPWTFIQATGYNYITAGENLAVDFTEAESVEQAWMQSPGHRANILNKNFEQIGIGIARGVFQGHDSTIVVQMFGTPLAQSLALQDKPTPVTASETAPVPAAQVRTPVVAGEQSPTFSITTSTPVLQNNAMYLSVTTSSPAAKVLARYGQKSVLLDAVSGTQWQTTIPLTSIPADSQITIEATALQGQVATAQVAGVAGTTAAAFNPVAGKANEPQLQFWGRAVSLRDMETRFYLLAIAGLLSCLVLAIAIRRHVQHLPLIANTSFVAMLAALLLITV